MTVLDTLTKSAGPKVTFTLGPAVLVQPAVRVRIASSYSQWLQYLFTELCTDFETACKIFAESAGPKVRSTLGPAVSVPRSVYKDTFFQHIGEGL